VSVPIILKPWNASMNLISSRVFFKEEQRVGLKTRWGTRAWPTTAAAQGVTTRTIYARLLLLYYFLDSPVTAEATCAGAQMCELSETQPEVSAQLVRNHLCVVSHHSPSFAHARYLPLYAVIQM
jgi:hypothetical protein